ncbi:CD44 antigen [Cololabis saira]|uniref:CD44 antigen n=1 Tax=Cololabis saira TaxID=129043 RepID=UPI002AD27C81|nr:CD44 antigen [Cololabis saira]
MWTFLLGVIFGLLASCRSDQLQVNSRGCTFAGVFKAEGADRHSLNFSMAEKVCEQLDSVMASQEQLQEAYDNKMETCRNGWFSNKSIAILRHSHHERCARNATGFLIFSNVYLSETFDVYCYDSEAGLEKNCTKFFTLLPPSPSPGEEQPQSDEEPGMAITPDDAIYGGAGVSTVAGEKDDLEEMNTFATIFHASLTTVDPEATNEGPERNGTGSGGSNFTFESLDSAPGSGMPPNSIEDERGSLVTPFGVLEKTQPPTEGGSTGKPIEDNIKLAPQGPNGKGQARARDDPEDNGSSNWLVVIGVIVAVAAILFVCAVVAKRKSWCGRQKTLVITSKEGSGGNGAAAASSSHNQDTEQEMVTLMNKENIQENGNTEEFTVIALEESPDKDQQA